MQCASCDEPTDDGCFTNWVTARKVDDTNRASPTAGVFITTRFYYDFAPVDLFVCNPCYAREAGRQKTLFWLFVGVTALCMLGTLYAVFGPDSVLRIVLGVLAVPTIVIGIGGAAHFSPVYRLEDEELQSHLTERFVRRLVRAGGLDVFWTERDFEANQQTLLGS